MKIYDARVGGGFPFVNPAPPCAAADECHGPVSSRATQSRLRCRRLSRRRRQCAVPLPRCSRHEKKTKARSVVGASTPAALTTGAADEDPGAISRVAAFAMSVGLRRMSVFTFTVARVKAINTAHAVSRQTFPPLSTTPMNGNVGGTSRPADARSRWLGSQQVSERASRAGSLEFSTRTRRDSFRSPRLVPCIVGLAFAVVGTHCWLHRLRRRSRSTHTAQLHQLRRRAVTPTSR